MKVHEIQLRQLLREALEQGLAHRVPPSGALDLLDINDIASLLRVKPSTVRRYVRDGRLPPGHYLALSAGKPRRVWKRSTIETWVSEVLVEATNLQTTTNPFKDGGKEGPNER